jgi:long-chain acyl-CoA synthetase
MTARNLAELHRHQADRFGPRVALRFKRFGLYQDMSWADYLANSLACAVALMEQGIKVGDRVGMLAENRLEWLLADMGILAAGAVNVPAHANLSGRQIHYQFVHAEINWLFVSTVAQWEKIQPHLGDIDTLKGVVLFDDPAAAIDGRLAWAGFVSRGLQALDAHERELERRAATLGPDDLATLMYTSGTTGNPKGVMLTHGNLLSNAVSMIQGAEISRDTITLSWLPYSHIYGRLVDHYAMMVAGATPALAVAPETLYENLREIRPTSFSAVPRFYEKVHADCQGDPQKLRKVFGDRIEWLNSGGAPLPLHLAQAFSDAGLLMLQGYGLTETSPVITFNRRTSNKLGTVGLPVPGVEVRIAGDGEILTRGPHVMRGYWKEPEATTSAIRDGWFHTGDLGRIDGEGYLTITGRKKELLVLSSGKKVVPPYLEGLLLADECIDQAVIYGEGKNFLTALIVPRFDNLRKLVRTEGVDDPDNTQLVRQPAVQALLAKRIAAALRDVASWEQVQKFILLPRPFSQDADELTVSLKLRRGVIFEKYRSPLEELYRSSCD